MQNNQKVNEPFKKKSPSAKNISSALSSTAFFIQILMFKKPYISTDRFSGTSLFRMWNMFLSLYESGSDHLPQMLTFLILFAITVIAPLCTTRKMPTLTIFLAIVNALAVHTVSFFWDGVFYTNGLKAESGYYGYLIANIIIIVNACMSYKNLYSDN